MRYLRYAMILTVVLAVTGIVCLDSSNSDADSEYIVYYLIDDPDLDADQYSIDCEGVYVTSSYVFFKTVIGSTSTTVGTLPSTENIVSRYYDTGLEDDGYVLNPEGADYGYDVSGWFADEDYTTRVTSSTTLASLDEDGDGVIILHMQAAKLYSVTYHMRNYGNGSVTNLMWYDGYYLEHSDEYSSTYTEGRFTEVDYIVQLVEGQTITDELATTGNVYWPGATSSLLYLALQYWAKGDGTYDIDEYTINGTTVNWVLLQEDGNYPAIESDDIPVYAGLTVTDDLDLDGDGVIELFGTSTRTGADLTFFLTSVYALQDTALLDYGDTGYDGYTEVTTDKIDAEYKPNSRTPQYVYFSDYVITLPNYDGFTYSSYETYQTTSTTSTITCTISSETSGGVTTYYATLTGRIAYSANTYSGGIVFNYSRDSVSITVEGESTTTETGYYGCDLALPSSFTSHTLYEWTTSDLTNDVWASGTTYYYTVSLDDLSAASPTITATWQEDQTDTVYTVIYSSRVDGVEIMSDVVTGDGSYITLPMISLDGYSHLGWALIDPDAGIDYDTTALVIYPGRTSFVPSAVSSEYKVVDGTYTNLISITLYAIWCTSYTIYFDSNGGSGSMDSIGPVMVNEYVTLTANSFTRNNYDFAGWATTSGGSVVYADQASVIGLTAEAAGEVTLYAVWTRNTYYIIYDGNNATSGSMSTDTASYYESFTLDSNAFSRTGYTYYGWSTTYDNSTYDSGMYISGSVIYDGSGTAIGYVDGATVTITDSLSLFAIWQPITYYVEFDANGGTGTAMATMTVSYGESVSLTANTYTNGSYTFGGWAGSDGNTYTNGCIIKNLTDTDGTTITMTAIWSYYYVVVNANNGSGNSDTHTAYVDIAFTMPECEFTYAGYIFSGWNTSADGTGTAYTAGSSYTNLAAEGGTFTVYAIWAVYTYYVAFDANGGSGTMETLTVEGGESITLTNTFTWENHEFLGWSKDGTATVATWTDGEVVVDIGTGTNLETVTLYAIWSEQIVTITVSGLTNASGSISDITAEAAFGLDQVLVGDLLTLSLGSDYSGYASYTSWFNTYYLVTWTYTSSDGSVSDVKYTYGGSITVTAEMDGGTLTATYTRYKDNIVYHINFESRSDSTTTYMGLDRTNNWRYSGEATLSECPWTVDGYIFCMWSTSSSSVSKAYAAGGTYSVSNQNNYDQTHNFYAVWIKIELTETEFYYTGSYITPEHTVTAVYGTSSATVTPASVSYTDNLNAGTATISVTLPTTYLGITLSTTFTILPAQVTVTVDDASKYYGEDDPTFTGTATCDTASVSSLTITYSRTSGEDAGTYAITASFSDSNYTLYSLTEGTLTINPAEVAIVVDDAQKNYGDSDPTFTGTVTCATASTDVLSISYYRTNSGTEAVGVYEGVLSATYTSNSNYTVVIAAGDFTIVAASTETAYYIIVYGGGGAETYTDSETVTSGTAFADKTVTANDGYSFLHWVSVTYSGSTVTSMEHVTYSSTLESDDIVAGTYMAFFAEGDSVTFDANGGSGSMSAQTFTDRSGTLAANAYTNDGCVFVGWSDSADGDVVYYDCTPLYKMGGLSTTDSENVLYAVWKEYSYTSQIVWTVDGYMISSNGSYLMTDSESTYAIIYGTTTASISADWLAVLAGSSMKLYAELDHGTIMFDAACVSTFAAVGQDITFCIKPVTASGSETFDVTSGDDVVVMYNITASYYSGSTKTFIHDLGGYATVTVDNTSGGNSVVYVGDDGDQPSDITYTADTITFVTDHFSLYEIVDEPEIETGKESMSLIVTIGAIAAALTGAVVVLNRRH